MRTAEQQANGTIARPERSGASCAAAVLDPALARPRAVPGFVPRRRLVRQLIASRRAPLVLLAAPTGYGKTCLLSEWSDVDERPFAWVTLEAADNEVEQMSAKIGRALERIGMVGAQANGRVSQRRSQFEGAGLPPFMRLLAQRGPLVLVLDDFEVLDSSSSLETIRVLADQLPHGSQLALGSRIHPALRLGRLRAHHSLVELHASDLRMDQSEAAMLLGAAGLCLDPEHVATLVRRTEGWPAALYLSAISLGDELDAAAQVEDFVGDDAVMSDYLREELIGGISDDARGFLRRTSILDRLSSSLCDAVLGRSDSAAVLQDLARRHLLLEPWERTEESYRCHGLLREMMLRELRLLDGEEARELHRRASLWHSAGGEPDQAVEHAVAADDVGRVGELLWANIPRYLDRAREALVSGWLARFTEEQIAGDAPLSLFLAHRHLNLGDLAHAEYWASAATDQLERPQRQADIPGLRAGMILIRAVVAREGITRMGEDATRAFELESEHSHWRAVCRLYQGIASHLAGDLGRACELLDDGVHRSAHMPSVESLCHAQLAIVSLCDDDWELAEERSELARTLIDRNDLEDSPCAALVFAVAALVRAQLGHADESKELVRRALLLLRTSDHYAPWYGEETRIMLARAVTRLTDMRRARTLLAEASRAARRVPDAPVLTAWLDEALGELDSGAAAALEGSSLLTLAELRILRFLPTHLSFREIGERLHVSTNTVKSQAHAVYRKLDASSRSEAVAHAARVGLIWSATSTEV
ncbi:MAG TPA: LuxR C-terminal-related transcriptional regulator [Solirubrobacteraceae bacterium]|jgi:LuxR family maltose regulon positive regulatory protein|nr:LuxR C-terminal-related transcriptional regulator [Solirubrobacteraceae bacterium]